MAQQANPNVNGQNDPWRAQEITDLAGVIT